MVSGEIGFGAALCLLCLIATANGVSLNVAEGDYTKEGLTTIDGGTIGSKTLKATDRPSTVPMPLGIVSEIREATTLQPLPEDPSNMGLNAKTENVIANVKSQGVHFIADAGEQVASAEAAAAFATTAGDPIASTDPTVTNNNARFATDTGADITCSEDSLKQVMQIYDPDPERTEPLSLYEQYDLEELITEVRMYCSHSTPEGIKSAEKHTNMIAVADDDECRQEIAKAHCDLASKPNNHRDDEVLDTSLGIQPMCNRKELKDAALAAGHLHDFLMCSINGMQSPSNAVDYCGLQRTPLPEGVKVGRPLGYAVMAHRSPERLARLMKAIYVPQNYYVIHIDPNSLSLEPVVDELRKVLCVTRAPGQKCDLPKNIAVVSKIPVTWGTVSVFDALYEAVKRLVAMGNDWTHLIPLSESDYPLKSQDEISKFLTEYGLDTNFLDIHNPATSLNEKRWRGRAAYVHCNMVSYPLHLLKPPSAVQIFDGSMWTILTRGFWTEMLSPQGRTIVDHVRSYAQDLEIPDETIQQTLVMASSSCRNVCNVNFRFENWQGDVSPNYFDIFDVPRLSQSHSFFARKFNNNTVLDSLEAAFAQAGRPILPPVP